jgi:inward rectifier potassium channel
MDLHARHTYSTSQILWDHNFMDIIDRMPDGAAVIDYGKLHDVVKV